VRALPGIPDGDTGFGGNRTGTRPCAILQPNSMYSILEYSKLTLDLRNAWWSWGNSLASKRREQTATEMSDGDKDRRVVTRATAVVLAAVLLVFLVRVASHSHEIGKSEATCQTCQAAHGGLNLHSAASSPHLQLPQARYLEPFVPTFHRDTSLHQLASRAPPSVVL